MSVINQQEIADRLSISRTTVSRCFTNHKGINPKTRAEVFSLAAKLGYQYQQPRSAPKSQAKSRSVGVLICADTDSSHRTDKENPGAELLSGISEFAQLHHWQTDVHFVSPRLRSIIESGYATIPGFKRRLWSGLLLMHTFPDTVVADLSARFPCVSLVEQYDMAPIDSVDANHYKGVGVLASRLRQFGHTRLGFFSRKNGAEAARAQRRLSAFVEALLRLNLPFYQEDVVHLDPTSHESAAAVYDHVAAQTRAGVTAWMCAADLQAYDLISALKERGLRVPEDVSVTGFDGLTHPAHAPSLETVRIPYYEIGFAGARRLLDKIEKRYESTQEILLECRVMEGETVGPRCEVSAEKPAL